MPWTSTGKSNAIYSSGVVVEGSTLGVRLLPLLVARIIIIIMSNKFGLIILM